MISVLCEKEVCELCAGFKCEERFVQERKNCCCCCCEILRAFVDTYFLQFHCYIIILSAHFSVNYVRQKARCKSFYLTLVVLFSSFCGEFVLRGCVWLGFGYSVGYWDWWIARIYGQIRGIGGLYCYEGLPSFYYAN